MRAGGAAALALAIAAAVTGPGVAQEIVGSVSDGATGQALGDASVVLMDNKGGIQRGTLTNPDGTFALVAPKAGKYTLRVGYPGYATIDSPVLEVKKGAVVEFSAQIFAEGGTPPGFAMRRAVGNGHFLSRDELQRRGGVRFTDLLQNTPGVKVIPLPDPPELGGQDPQAERPSTADQYYTVRVEGALVQGAQAGAVQFGESVECAPGLYVNGAWWGEIDRVSADGVDFRITPTEVQGIEIYMPSQVPEQFAAGRTLECGVVVVWRTAP